MQLNENGNLPDNQFPYHKTSGLTLTTAWMIHGIIVKPPAVAQLVQAFVVVCCSICGAHWILIGRAILVTNTASFMGTVRFADSK